MAVRLPLLVAIFAATAPVAAAAHAQEREPSRGWNDLMADLTPGASVKVEQSEGRVQFGRSVAVDDSSLTLRPLSGSSTARLQRDELRRVAVKTGSRQDAGLLIGVAAGSAFLAVTLARGDDYSAVYAPAAVASAGSAGS